jgi:hypothetical protein
MRTIINFFRKLFAHSETTVISSPVADPVTSPVSTPSAPPTSTGPITIDAHVGQGFTPDQRTKITRAIGLWQEAWNSSDFATQVQSAQFTQTNDDALKVYQTITAVKNKTFKLEINNVPNGSETAATNTVTGVTTIQALYLDRAMVFDLVNTFSHEYTHTPEGGDYKHSKYYSRWVPYLKLRPWSTPYQIGDITQAIALKLPVQKWEQPAELQATT